MRTFPFRVPPVRTRGRSCLGTAQRDKKDAYRFIEAHAPRNTTYERAAAILVAGKERAAVLEAKIAARLDK